jgi:phosphonopyruvate decarboxylase
MLATQLFGEELQRRGYDFFAGVPCSFLKNLINHAINTGCYVAAANEGDAVAVAAGAWLGGRKSVVLMQNSGLTNATSPLTSLNAIFRLPVLGFVSLRGEPGVADEPQHQLMGRITTGMLDLMEIRWEYLSPDQAEAARQLARADAAVEHEESFFFVVRKDTFDQVDLGARPAAPAPARWQRGRIRADTRPLRCEALKTIVARTAGDTLRLATTGYTGRELYTIGDSAQNLYQVGSMGCVGSLGLGLALARPDRDVVVIDGDGALLMRLGALAVIARQAPPNLLHVVLDNQAYESTGGQATVSGGVDFTALASAAGYPRTWQLHDLTDLEECIRVWKKEKGLTFACLNIAAGAQKEIARPALTPPQVKERFRRALHG